MFLCLPDAVRRHIGATVVVMDELRPSPNASAAKVGAMNNMFGIECGWRDRLEETCKGYFVDRADMVFAVRIGRFLTKDVMCFLY